MSKINDGGPAFPVPFILDPTRGTAGGEYVDGADAGAPTGITMRDFFATHAMNAMLSDHEYSMEVRKACTRENKKHSLVLAYSAYYYADAMLAARQTGGAA